MGDPASGSGRRRDKDVVLDRDDGGETYVAIPRTVRHYAVDDLDWGYIGPATAELALNILNWILPPGVDGEPPIACEDGECSAVAWRLHRTFMAEFLVRVPHAGGCLSESGVRQWVLAQIDENVCDHSPRTDWFSLMLPR